jgi:long-chain acyl-CoA synthetase
LTTISARGPASLDEHGRNQTLLSLLLGRAARNPDRVAFRYKARGIWQGITWHDLATQVQDLAAGLRDLGIGPGMLVAVAADVSPSWLLSLLSVYSVGAMPLSLYIDLGGEELSSIFTTHDIQAAIIDRQDWMQALAERGVKLPERIFSAGSGRAARWDAQEFLSISDVATQGAARRLQAGPEWAGLDGERTGDEPAIVFSTAGTSGQPQLVVHSTASLVSAAQRLIGELGPRGRIRPTDTAVIELPAGHIGAVLMSIVVPMLTGMVPHMPEQAIAEAVAEVRPTLSLALAQAWELRLARIQVRTDEATGIRRLVLRAAEQASTRFHRAPAGGSRKPMLIRLANAVAYCLILLPLQRQLGLERMGPNRPLVIGPLAAGVVELWQGWGIDLREVYGMAETGGIVATVDGGRLAACDGIDLALASDGRLMIRSRALYAGYWEAGAVHMAVGSDGWLPTYDIARALEDNALALVGPEPDRVKDSSGSSLSSLVAIDAALRCSPYVRAAAAFQGPDGSITAVLYLDLDSVLLWASRTGIRIMSAQALMESEDVLKMLIDEISRVNQVLAAKAIPKIDAFELSSRKFALGRELSPAWTVRRRNVLRAEKRTDLQ